MPAFGVWFFCAIGSDAFYLLSLEFCFDATDLR